MDGLLVIDKPVGPTSHDVVARVRRIVGESRIGHTGTLDPLASGVLALVLGRATRLVRFLDADDKCYEAAIRLGFSTDTRDALGQMIGTHYNGAMPSRAVIDRELDRFRGTFLQQPPAFSAKKVDGRRSYRLARAHARATANVAALPSIPVPPALPAPASVTAETIDIVGVDGEILTLRISCSGGFYVRSLAHDLGEALGTGGHLIALRRTRASGAGIAQAVPLDVLEAGLDGRARAIAALVPLSDMLPAFRAIVLTDAGANRAARGCELGPSDLTEGSDLFAETRGHLKELFRLMDPRGALVGIAERKPSGLLHPAVVLV